jgi:hypothetical protein
MTMTNMRDILDLINEMSEEEGSIELHDEFDIELSEEVIIESGVIDINEDGILIEGDEKSLQLLEEHGLILEETDWSKYDEPTINRIKSGKTKPVDRTNYNIPPAMRKDTKGKPGYELRKDKLKDMGALKEDDVEESGLQAYLGKKKYGEKGMKALQKAGREGASKEKMAKIRAQHDKLDEVEMDEAKYQGREVPLGKPMAGDVKKRKVYVKKPNGKVVKVNFGDKKMRIKKSNPKRRKSFRARHNCKNPGPRWKARYWSCRAW